MASRLIVPFDNNPVAVSVKTSSYTIPVGRFARVYVECDSGGIFTINAVNAVVTSPFINVDVVGTNADAVYTVPTGYSFIAASAGGATGNSAVFFNGNSVAAYTEPASASANICGAQVGPGGSITAGRFSGSDDPQVAGVAIPSNATNRQAEFFLPTGTVINGSGNWKAVVQEYNVIS